MIERKLLILVMTPNSYFIRIEGEMYNLDELKDKNDEILYDLIEFLKKSEIIETFMLGKRETYKINYVGIIVYKEFIIIVLPKFYYRLNLKPESDIETVKRELIETISVLRIYSKNKEVEIQNLEYLNLEEHNNEIALADFILEDFVKNGLINIKNVYEVKNKGIAISWPKTIEKIEPIIANSTPIYINNINYYQKKNNEFQWIHREALIYCDKMYSKILGYNIKIKEDYNSKLNLKDKEIENLLRKQIILTYKGREKKLLKALYMLWKNIQSKNSSNNINLYGVKNFYDVWEKICKYIFNSEDELKKVIKKLTLTQFSRHRELVLY